ncbi:hypothetical protein ACFQ9X_50450 [Catenulispora yoronensis]
MNDEYLRRPARDVDPDQLPDYGFGGEPLFRDEVPPVVGGGPGSTGFHDASLFRTDSGVPGQRYESAAGTGRGGNGFGLDYGSGGDYGTGILGQVPTPRPVDGRQAAGIGPRGAAVGNGGGAGGVGGVGGGAGGRGAPGGPGGAGAPGAPEGSGGDPQRAANEGPLRVVPAEQASALLRIKLPDSPPVPATTLRGDAPIETVVEASQMLHRVSPARPNALPGDVLALTTATMVVPMPGAAFGGLLVPQRSARLTASVPPDLASRAEADLLSDTVEQFFGDFDAIGRELEAQRAGGVAEAARAIGSGAGASVGAGLVGVGAGFGGETGPEGTSGPGGSGPNSPTAPPAGRYGVPTQFPGYDAARRSPVGMRYLGGIFHDSSGESSFYDPATESLVPMGAAAFSAADFRRISTSGVTPRPVPPPRTGPQTAPPPRQSGAAAAGTSAKALSGAGRSGGSAGLVGSARSVGSAASSVRPAGRPGPGRRAPPRWRPVAVREPASVPVPVPGLASPARPRPAAPCRARPRRATTTPPCCPPSTGPTTTRTTALAAGRGGAACCWCPRWPPAWSSAGSTRPRWRWRARCRTARSWTASASAACRAPTRRPSSPRRWRRSWPRRCASRPTAWCSSCYRTSPGCVSTTRPRSPPPRPAGAIRWWRCRRWSARAGTCRCR